MSLLLDPTRCGDPFDRMLVAQARVGGLSLVTNDAQIKRDDALIPTRRLSLKKRNLSARRVKGLSRQPRLIVDQG